MDALVTAALAGLVSFLIVEPAGGLDPPRLPPLPACRRRPYSPGRCRSLPRLYGRPRIVRTPRVMALAAHPTQDRALPRQLRARRVLAVEQTDPMEYVRNG
jgi:hypothetical protein